MVFKLTRVHAHAGKTAAFLVPVCAALCAASNSLVSGSGSTVGQAGSARPRAVVMAPTRELASQVGLSCDAVLSATALELSYRHDCIILLQCHLRRSLLLR